MCMPGNEKASDLLSKIRGLEYDLYSVFSAGSGSAPAPAVLSAG